MSHTRPASALAIALLLVTAALAQEAPRTVDSLDVGRYAGLWYEIARLPNEFQSQCVSDVTATYGLRPDGRLDVKNRCRTDAGGFDEALGVARIADDRTHAKLKVRFAPAFLSFLPFVWGDYWVLGLDPDYRWAVVGTPDRADLWILARDRQMTEAQLGVALAQARAQGFDVSRVIRTRHEVAADDPPGSPPALGTH